ncbi:MAG: FkbM family methyltransferase [Bacteroidales bacterium]|nr:FkbM family methyltransferase [Bacteroidales bacterium]
MKFFNPNNVLQRIFGIRIKLIRNQKAKPLFTQSIITFNLKGFNLVLNEQHKLPTYIKACPGYSSNLSHISELVSNKYRECEIIDVGANVGDSIALIRSTGIKNHIHAIEGDSYYYKLLIRNCKQFQSVSIYNLFLGEKREEIKANTQTIDGTMSIESINGTSTIEINTLDSFINDKSIQNPKFLKIDTDGFDFSILKGGFKSISEFHPVLFIEYDVSFEMTNDENITSVFNFLLECGYRKIVYYDNKSNLIISANLDDKVINRQLNNYIKSPACPIHYYDVCILHESDVDIYEQLLSTVLATLE